MPDEQDGETALIKAAASGHHECVSILVANGADVNMATTVYEYVIFVHFASIGCVDGVPVLLLLFAIVMSRVEKLL